MPTPRNTLFLTILVLESLASSARAEPTLNLESALADTGAELRAGRGADVLVIGDSLSFSGSFAADVQGSYLNYLRLLLQEEYGDGGEGYQGLSVFANAGFNQGWTHGTINQDVAPHQSLDGLWASSSSHAYPPVSTDARFSHSSRSVLLHYVTSPGGGKIEVQLDFDDRPVLATLDTRGAAGVALLPLTLPSNDQYWLQPLGDGPVTILGQVNMGDEAGIRVHRAANGGWGVPNFLQRDGTFDEQVRLLDPDLVMIWLGQNDQRFTTDDYTPQVEALIDRLQADVPDAEFIVCASKDDGGGNIHRIGAVWADVAARRGLGFMNMFELIGPHQAFYADRNLYDAVHFNQRGAEKVGRMIFDLWKPELDRVPPAANTDVSLWMAFLAWLFGAN
jgi:lysophospholipase L1-like esterase